MLKCHKLSFLIGQFEVEVYIIFIFVSDVMHSSEDICL